MGCVGGEPLAGRGRYAPRSVLISCPEGSSQPISLNTSSPRRRNSNSGNGHFERRQILEQLRFDEGQRRCRYFSLMQAQANPSVRHDGVRVRPCLADFGRGETQPGIKVQRGSNIRRCDRELQERPNTDLLTHSADADVLHLGVVENSVLRPLTPGSDSLTPPNGATSVEMMRVFNPTMPYSMASGNPPATCKIASVQICRQNRIPCRWPWQSPRLRFEI